MSDSCFRPKGYHREIGEVMSSSPNSETTTPAVNIVNHEEGYSIVVSDPKIMGGTPVIRGTRIPVRFVAEMRRQGAAVEEILAGYPSLTAELIALAEIH